MSCLLKRFNYCSFFQTSEEKTKEQEEEEKRKAEEAELEKDRQKEEEPLESAVINGFTDTIMRGTLKSVALHLYNHLLPT